MNRIHFFVEGSLRKYRARFESVCPAPMTVPKGQDLLRQCVTQGWLYYILDGLAKVYVATSDGGEQIVEFMRQDTLIGMDCIDIENKSVVSIASVTEMHVLPFTPDILRKMIFQDPELGFDLVIYYGEVLREVASFINVSRAQLAKLYGKLRKEGIIDTGNHYVAVLDADKLQAYRDM